MAEAPIQVPWKTARKRSRQKKERIEMRNFGQILIKNQQKIQEELSDLRNTGAEAGSVKTLSIWLESSLTMGQSRPSVLDLIFIKNQQKIQKELSLLRDSGAEAGSVKALSVWLENSLTMRQPRPSVVSAASKHFKTYKFLEENLTFKKVKDAGNNPFLQLPSAEGARISKKMSYFLRHNLPHGQYSPQDGSVPIFALERSLSLPREKILLATSPMYDEERKRRFVVLEFFHPDASVTIRVAALGGHSMEILAPPGHYLLGKESLKQLCPLVHNTNAVKDISSAGFISQQQRKGGVNFCAKESKYRPNASHAVKVETDSATKLLELGYQFFGNRFCETIYGMGVWEESCWSGQIPTHFLTISLKQH